jgi:hypothetical protein
VNGNTLPGWSENVPWLPLYLDADDAGSLLDYLNADEQAAFIVSTGPGRWRAVERLEALPDGRYCIWVHAAGALPLLGAGPARKPGPVPDPWRGWRGRGGAADPSLPYFGAGHPAVVWLEVRTRGRERAGALGMSSFQWIGNRYGPAPPAAKKWWQALGRHVRKCGKRVPRRGRLTGRDPEVWAMPSALERLRAGAARDDNP